MRVSWKKLLKRIPNVITINRVKYEVLWSQEFPTGDGNTLGETRFDKHQIVIKQDEPPKETVHTAFHEWLHAVSHEYNVNLTENQVLAFEKCLPDLLKLIDTMGEDK